MKISITLSKRGPFMWFLGKPKEILITLNQGSPGPIEIDFDDLNEPEQQKIINSIQNNSITTDADFKDLHGKWLKSHPAVTEEEINKTCEADNWILEQKRVQEKRIELEQKQKVKEEENKIKEEKDRKKCQDLIKMNLRPFKSSLRGYQDTSFLQMIIKAEKVGKNRKGILNFLQEKIHSLAIAKEKKIVKQIQKKAEKQLKKIPIEKTYNINVVESEQKTVVLTPEDLIADALK